MQTVVKPMVSLRLKVTDRCPWNCWWCHNEGTGVRNIALTKDIPWAHQTQEMMTALKDHLGLTEIHLTGGEPTSHPHVRILVSGLRDMGFGLKMTTIGCAEDKMKDLIQRGVSGFNFSIHSLDSRLLTETQIDRTESTMQNLLARQLNAVRIAKDHGVTVKANLVIATTEDYERARTVYEWARETGVELRLLNELSLADESEMAVLGLLDELGAIPIERRKTHGTSGYSDVYRTRDGTNITFKRIGDVFLPAMCDGCTIRETVCHERFYAIRLEYRVLRHTPEFLVRLCLHRQDPDVVVPINQFLNGPLLEAVKDQIEQNHS